jgi:hypothetical protein
MTSETTEAAAPAPARRRLRWWREVIYVLAVYLVYSKVRNGFGSAGGPLGHANAIAYGHAKHIIAMEKWLGLFVEPPLQHWYLRLPAHGFVAFWNFFYGSIHFIVTGVALILLYRRQPERYPLWRNTLACTTLLALIGFASFSLMPPRLLAAPFEQYGPPPSAHADDYGFVDTLAKFPAIWSFDKGEFKKISNQYAAMPSLHIGWSLWVVAVLLPMVRRRWAQILICLHPIATLFCIMVTANHYWLDGVGGAVTFGCGFLLARTLTRAFERLHGPVADQIAPA